MNKIRTLTSALSLLLAGALHAQTTTESNVSIQFRVHLNELSYGAGLQDVTTYSTRSVKTADIIADLATRLERPVSRSARIIRRDVMDGPTRLSTHYYLRDRDVEDLDITEFFFYHVNSISEGYVINDLRQTGSRKLIEDTTVSITGVKIDSPEVDPHRLSNYELTGVGRATEKLLPIKGQPVGCYKLSARTINLTGYFNSPLLENSGICIGTIKEQGAKVVPNVTPQ